DGGFHMRSLGASGVLVGGQRVGQPPEADGLVMAAGQGIPAVMGEDHAVNHPLVAIEAAEVLPGRHLPKTDAAGGTARQGKEPVRRQSYPTDGLFLPPRTVSTPYRSPRPTAAGRAVLDVTLDRAGSVGRQPALDEVGPFGGSGVVCGLLFHEEALSPRCG